MEPALRAAAGLGRWFVGCAVLPVCGDFQRRRRQHSATTAFRALPMWEWPVLGIPLRTAGSHMASAVRSRCCGRACTQGCGRAGQVVYEECGFADLWRFPEEEAATTAHRALPVCKWPALDIPWGTARSMQPLRCAAGVVGHILGAAAGLGRWFVRSAGLRF